MTPDAIEAVLRRGMCSPSKLADGPCECCAEKLAAVEAVHDLRALADGALDAQADAERRLFDARADLASAEHDLARLIAISRSEDRMPGDPLRLALEIESNGRDGWVARALSDAPDAGRDVVRELRDRVERAEAERAEARDDAQRLINTVGEAFRAADIGDVEMDGSPRTADEIAALRVRALSAEIERLRSSHGAVRDVLRLRSELREARVKLAVAREALARTKDIEARGLRMAADLDEAGAEIERLRAQLASTQSAGLSAADECVESTAAIYALRAQVETLTRALVGSRANVERLSQRAEDAEAEVERLRAIAPVQRLAAAISPLVEAMDIEPVNTDGAPLAADEIATMATSAALATIARHKVEIERLQVERDGGARALHMERAGRDEAGEELERILGSRGSEGLRAAAERLRAEVERARQEHEGLADILLSRHHLRVEVERLRDELATEKTRADRAVVDARDWLCEVERLRVDLADARVRIGGLYDLRAEWQDVDAIRTALGEHATGDLVADVRRLVERLDGREHDVALADHVGDERGAQIATLRTYLARALRGCDPAERTAIEADMAREVNGG